MKTTPTTHDEDQPVAASGQVTPGNIIYNILLNDIKVRGSVTKRGRASVHTRAIEAFLSDYLKNQSVTIDTDGNSRLVFTKPIQATLEADSSTTNSNTSIMRKVINFVLYKPNLVLSAVLAYVFFGVAGAREHWFGPIEAGYVFAFVGVTAVAAFAWVVSLYTKPKPKA